MTDSEIVQLRLMADNAIEHIKHETYKHYGGECPACIDEAFCHERISTCTIEPEDCWMKYFEK